MQEKLEGVVETVIFQSNNGNFSVFKVLSPIVGSSVVTLNSISPLVGEEISLAGDWTLHPRFGKQFKAFSCKRVGDISIKGIERFLGSGAIKGVGRIMATKIVAHFGLKTLEILNEEPQRLTEVSGIGKKKAEAIITSYSEVSEIRGLMMFLEENGISSNYAPKIQSFYGGAAIEIIKNDPYQLAYDIDGIGFKIADRIAQSLGFLKNDERRLRAGIEYVLQRVSQAGHVCVPKEILTNQTAKILEVTSEEAYYTISELLREDRLKIEESGENTYIYPEYLYFAEKEVANKLLTLKDSAKELRHINIDFIINAWEKHAGIKLAKIQKNAIDSAAKYGVLVVTGGPGTGKTTIVRGILSLLEAAGCKVLLSAPTGRAARRLSESTDRPAMTIHKMLEYIPHEGMFAFGKNETEQLEADAIIIDEASMLDIPLAAALLKAIPKGCRIIFVGDIDQLPSVGPGSVLKDIIKSTVIPVVRLDQIFRQAAESQIILNAHAINHSLMPSFKNKEEFDFIDSLNEEDVADKIVEYYYNYINKKDMYSIQVLSPMHRLSCGVENLNRLLQEKLNPPQQNKEEITFVRGVLRVGDKIMQIKNNYEKDVFNGDLGWVEGIQGSKLIAFFPDVNNGVSIDYTLSELDELQLAYAMTVHKSQGSEYSTILLALSKGHHLFLQKNILYTAVTRAKKNVVIVGQKAALQTAVLNNRMRKRYSLLAERLKEIFLY